MTVTTLPRYCSSETVSPSSVVNFSGPAGLGTSPARRASAVAPTNARSVNTFVRTACFHVFP